MQPGLAKYIIVIGIIITIIGLLLMLNRNAFNWLGRLPGDIRIERENFKFYFPIGTMILISIVVTILLNVIKKFL